jgi:hypothetical protein
MYLPRPTVEQQIHPVKRFKPSKRSRPSGSLSNAQGVLVEAGVLHRMSGATENRRVKMLVAMGRIGSTPQMRLQWLYDFVTRGLSDSVGADAARWEVLAFAATGWCQPLEEARPNDLVQLARARRGCDASRVRTGPSLLDTDPALELALIQRKVRAALRRFAVDRRWELPLPGHVFQWSDEGAIVPVPQLDATKQAQDIRSWFYGAVLGLVATLGPRLRVCANDTCRRLFLPEGRQVYCSGLCSGRTRQKRHRERHGEELSETKHRVYTHKRRLEFGPKVRVRRQRRRPGR